jgi:hypothetical protein
LLVRDSSELQNSNPTLLEDKKAQKGKQMRVGACKGFAYYSVKLILLANGNRYEVDSSTSFLTGKASFHLEYCFVPTLAYSDTNSYLQYVVQSCKQNEKKTAILNRNFWCTKQLTELENL